jgi:hypothetical protein
LVEWGITNRALANGCESARQTEEEGHAAMIGPITIEIERLVTTGAGRLTLAAATRWVPAFLAALVLASSAQGSPASDAAYEAGKRHIEAREYDMGLALLDRAAAADSESPSGYRARLLQILVLNAKVGRCLSALTSYDRGLRFRSASSFQRQRDAVAEEGHGYLRQLLRASLGYRQHVPPRSECVLEVSPPEPWSLSIIDSAEKKVEAGRPLTPSECQNYRLQTLRVWLTMTLSQFYCRPGRDDSEVMRNVRGVMDAREPIDPWLVLSTTVDTMAAVVNRSLLEEQIGRAQVVHREMRGCVAALLLKAPADEGIVARTKAEASVKQVYGEQRGAEWFRDLEFATRLVRARQ